MTTMAFVDSGRIDFTPDPSNQEAPAAKASGIQVEQRPRGHMDTGDLRSWQESQGAPRSQTCPQASLPAHKGGIPGVAKLRNVE